MSRIALFLALLGLGLLPNWTTAVETNLTRQEIRSLPITVRPSRPGHFYGNTVRRLNQRRG